MARVKNTRVLEVVGLDGTLYRVMSDVHGLTCVAQAYDKDGNALREEDGTPRFVPMKCAHFGTLRGACRRLLEEGLRLEDNTSVGLLMVRMEAWLLRIETAIAEADRCAS